MPYLLGHGDMAGTGGLRSHQSACDQPGGFEDRDVHQDSIRSRKSGRGHRTCAGHLLLPRQAGRYLPLPPMVVRLGDDPRSWLYENPALPLS